MTLKSIGVAWNRHCPKWCGVKALIWCWYNWDKSDNDHNDDDDDDYVEYVMNDDDNDEVLNGMYDTKSVVVWH